MTARLVRLRIAGFKSFAEPVSLDILPGLTGIVGPNGCGKSNVADALRWAMGEASARSLRGGEMDDVIFAGTAARASRNLAEVSISLEAGAAPLPAPFEQDPELQVTRRIERGAGSSFRANGRELRARDVQTLYADLASGARSSGMVSQGRVAALVGARPEERRQVLEEAAGIAGLHARRHEAELKLRASEQNMGRAEESRLQMDTARENLRRQARQAARYRSISDLIRAAEAEHLAVLHGRAAGAHARAQTALDTARSALAAAEEEHETAGAALADAEAALPQPRQREADARGVLERRRIEADLLAEQARRAQNDHDAADARLRDLDADLAASGRAVHDAQNNVGRLGEECERLAAEQATLPAELAVATDTAQAAQNVLAGCQAAAEAAAGQAAYAARQAAQADDVLRHAGARAAELRTRHEAAEAELASAARLRVSRTELDAARGRQAGAQSAFDEARVRLEVAEAARIDASSCAADAAGRAARQQALRRQAEEASAACARRLGDAEAAWSEAVATLARLEGERMPQDRLSAANRMTDSAEAELVQAEERIDAAERAASSARAEAAEAHRETEASLSAQRRALAARAAAHAHRAHVSAQADEAQRALELAEASPPTAEEMEAAALAEAGAADLREQADRAARQALSSLAEAAQAASRSRSEAAGLAAQAALLSAESAGLAASLGPEHRDGVLSGLHVPAGLEAAVGAALGAEASLDPEATMFWRGLAPLPAPAQPAGTVPLASLVQSPGALGRALSHTFLLDAAADGDAVQAKLAPGMIVVDRDGACWRWDGYVARAGAPNPAAAALLIRRRLERVSAALQAAQDAASQADIVCAARVSEAAEAEGRAADARLAAEQARQRHDEAVCMVESLRSAARQRDTRIEGLLYAAHRMQSELEAAGRLESDTDIACAGFPAPDPDRLARLDAAASAYEQALDAARQTRISCRNRATELRQAAQALTGEAGRTLALIEAAASTAERASSLRESAQPDFHAAEAVLAALPDQAALDEACAGLAATEQSCRAEEGAARIARGLAETALEAARQAATDLQLAHGHAETRWASLSDFVARAGSDLNAGEQGLVAAERARGGLPDPTGLAQEADVLRDRLEAARQDAVEAQARRGKLEAAFAHVERAAPSMAAELGAWQARLDEAALRHTNLAGRHLAASAERQALAGRPAELTAQAARVQQAFAAALATHEAAESALEAAHGRVRALAGAERDSAREAGACRERQARAQGGLEAAASQVVGLLARAAERLGAGAGLPDAPDVSDAALDRAVRRCERLVRERDEMGPVNLRAELEVAELDERVAALARDQAELTVAIAKLRGAIGHLNREGRERLQAVFSKVDQHFRTLFTRMMGGGQAHLAWTGSDDPLEAGLDIFAEPPGKKLSSLSLLSGGEQALTALSLIFAVFRCTPSPVCVLDEVDAPLDDANVDRFCTLLEDMARETGTSFLVVTHHQLTMSRMDRLYGVTMQERGVSRLLSVDLSRALAMVEPILAAAE